MDTTPSLEDTLEHHQPTGREWECACGAMHATRTALTAHIADMVRDAAYGEIAEDVDDRILDAVRDAVSRTLGDLERDLTDTLTSSIRSLIP